MNRPYIISPGDRDKYCEKYNIDQLNKYGEFRLPKKVSDSIFNYELKNNIKDGFFFKDGRYHDPRKKQDRQIFGRNY